MADGDSLKLGNDNYADHVTRLSGGWKGDNTGLEVEGRSIGVVAYSGYGGDFGVLASSSSPGGAGVWGSSHDPYGGGPGVGVLADSVLGPAIQASSEGGPGVYANSVEHAGVYAYSVKSNAVYGTSGGNGVVGYAQAAGAGIIGLSERGAAGAFYGPVLVTGSLTVLGAKAAAVPGPGGSYRRLYSVESPESWFEDFGRASLVGGKAKVALEPRFAALVRRDHYHVFLTPLGDSNGLFVKRQSPKGFEVREQRGGKSTLKFSYRVVARRRDIQGSRLEKVEVTQSPSRPAQPHLLNVRELHRPSPKTKQSDGGEPHGAAIERATRKPRSR